MMIFISGPYGVGKSTVAEALAPQLDALIFDAEAVGNAVRDNYPDWPFGAIFEDYPLWAECCVRLLADLHERYGHDILVPMTLLRASSRSSLIDRLEAMGVETRLIVLTASHQTVRNRILARGESEDCWCMQHIDEARQESALMPGAYCIGTDEHSVDEIAQAILDLLRR